MTPREADAALFGDALACEEARPARFERATPDAAARHAEAQRTETFLQALALVEDSRGEDPEEHGPGTLALQRIEARLDLLTTLVAGLLQGTERDPPTLLRWSSLGACLVAADASPGDAGWLRVQPSDRLPQSLRLPVRVLATEASPDGPRAWLGFDDLPLALSAALERHLFRQHRREVAERRRPR